MPFTKEIGLKDFYEFYRKSCEKKDKKFVDYTTYAKIIKETNSIIRDNIIYKSDTLMMPMRLGQLRIHKFENVYKDTNKVNWKVNYKLSKETGNLVYHGSKYGYKWKWFKKTCVVQGKKFYVFKPCRTASRMIADAINNKQIDYYSI